MLIGCYTVHLYCDGCERNHDFRGPDEYTGRTEASCIRQAKRAVCREGCELCGQCLEVERDRLAAENAAMREALCAVWNDVAGDVGGEPHLISAAALYRVRAALRISDGGPIAAELLARTPPRTGEPDARTDDNTRRERRMMMEETTRDWLEYFEQSKAAGDLRNIFWKMHEICGLPEGVDGNDPRVIAALEELRKANAGCGNPGARTPPRTGEPDG